MLEDGRRAVVWAGSLCGGRGRIGDDDGSTILSATFHNGFLRACGRGRSDATCLCPQRAAGNRLRGACLCFPFHHSLASILRIILLEISPNMRRLYKTCVLSSDASILLIKTSFGRSIGRSFSFS